MVGGTVDNIAPSRTLPSTSASPKDRARIIVSSFWSWLLLGVAPAPSYPGGGAWLRRARPPSVDSLLALHGREDRERIARRRDFVNAHDSSPALHGEDRAGQACREPIVGRFAGDATEARLPRQADQHRIAERRDRVEAREKSQVVLGRLAETEAGVHDDARGADAGGNACGRARGEEVADLGDDIAVHRVRLHRLRVTLHVHEAHRRIRPGDDVDGT